MAINYSGKTRIESDLLGEMEVPVEALYGVQTLRGYENFHITGVKMDKTFIANIVRIKKVAAKLLSSHCLSAKQTSKEVVCKR